MRLRFRQPGPLLHRRWHRYRRPASAVLLAVAAGVTVDAVVATPPPSVATVTAAADLPAGSVVRATDLASTALPPAAVPDGALASSALVGRTLASPVRRGEPLTDARLVGPGLLRAQPTGVVAVPIRLSDPAAVSFLRPGDAVRVLAGADEDPSGLGLAAPVGETLADRATVLALTGGSTGLLDDTGATTVVVAVDDDEALALAAAAERRPLSLALLGETSRP